MTVSLLAVIIASFLFTQNRLTGFVRDYLYHQRIRQDSLSVERLAATVAPLLQSAQTDALNETISAAGSELGGRILVLDPDGKVQFDSFTRLEGTRLALPVVVSILAEGEQQAYAIYRRTGPDVDPSGDDSRVSYCAVRLTGSEGDLGVLVYASPVAEMLNSLAEVERQVGLVFLAAALIAVLLTGLFSRLLTRPINDLTKTIQKMGKGDLSVRANVRGNDEMRTLAENYNVMAEQLESLDQSRSQFVSNASHELKTPLTTMKILLENVLYQPDMPREMQEEFLGDMNHEIDRLSNVVGDLLTLSRMDSHKMELHWKRVNLSETVNETIHLLLPQADRRGQHLESRVTPGILMNGDASKLSQIVYNLTENALKYTGDGGRIVVTLVERGKNAILTVRDNGIGIPAEDVGHIFERFYRVDKARSRETGGTGLGLSIVRQLIQLHGGEITVSSRQGEGSEFTVRLPLEGKPYEASLS